MQGDWPYKGVYRNRRVLITGHTGFKGAWLAIWLRSLGANVTGYSLEPPTEPSLFEVAGLSGKINHFIGDVADYDRLKEVMADQRPEIVFHLAAQSLVRTSYREPRETFATNVIGTVNLLDAVRGASDVRAVVVVTSDKCYENREWVYGYRETDRLGGYDPYSSSKACAEQVTAAYRNSFFNPGDYAGRHQTAVASVRAGNVIGGGDWAMDRLVPDCMRALLKGERVVVRNPGSVRPWQHVLDPLRGYLMLCQRLWEEGPSFGEAWNFGPSSEDARTVEWLVRRVCSAWGGDAGYLIDGGEHPHEANLLKLDCSKADARLGWRPVWGIERAIEAVVEWTMAYGRGEDMEEVCLRQIGKFMETEG